MKSSDCRSRSHALPQRVFAAAIVTFSLSLLISACSSDANGARNQDCAKLAHGTLPWGYYPGFGCGPIPPAQTIFS